MTVASGTPKEPAQGPLEGEDIETEHWEDARHWMSIYDDLIRFKLGLLERVKRELPKLHPVAQTAAKVDVTFIENQMAGYYATREKRRCSPIESSSSCSSSSTIPTVSTPPRRSWDTRGRTPPYSPKKSVTTFRG